MKYVIILFCLFSGLSGYASEPDSMKVERWLREASSLPKDSCRTLHFAKKMLGTPYVAGTLDVNNEETLVVHLDKVDCTTLVETVLALAIADQQGKQNFEAFKEALMLVRYRDGHLAGYSSRLHYFSDWIKNNEAKGLVRECTSDTKISLSSKLSLNFMSTHSDSYLPMKKDTSLISQVALFEKAWQGVEVRFIPKEKLNQSPNELKIKNGDILFIVFAAEFEIVKDIHILCPILIDGSGKRENCGIYKLQFLLEHICAKLSYSLSVKQPTSFSSMFKKISKASISGLNNSSILFISTYPLFF